MLKLEQVSKTFYPNTGNEKRAMDHLDLLVNTGEFVTVIGSNGAGKSTLFNLIAGSILPDSGRILLDNEDITFLPEHKRASRIGRIFQDPMRGTAPSMTVEENLALSYLRGKKHRFGFGISEKETRRFQRAACPAGTGAGRSNADTYRDAFGRTAPGSESADVYDGDTETAAA